MPPTNNNKDEMLYLHGTAIVQSQHHPFTILVDSGCTRTCMPYASARQIGLQWDPRRRGTYHATIADGRSLSVRHDAELTLRIGTYQFTMRVDMMRGDVGSGDMLLGMDWLVGVNPRLGFRPLSLRVRDWRGGEHELVGHRRGGNGRGRHGGGCGGRGCSHGNGRDDLRCGTSGLVPIYRNTVQQGSSGAWKDESHRGDWTVLFPERKWLDYASRTADNNKDKTAELEQSLREHIRR